MHPVNMTKSAFFAQQSDTAQVSQVASDPAQWRSHMPVASAPRQTNTLSRGWRFPSSRKFLWDRTPQGRTEVIEPQDRLPLLVIPSNLHTQIASTQQPAPNGGSLRAVVSCSTSQQLVVSLEAVTASGPGGMASVPVRVLDPSQRRGDDSNSCSAMQDVPVLATALQHSLDLKGSAQLTSGLALSCTLSLHPPSTPAARAGHMGAAATAAGVRGATLSVTMLLPHAALELTPLYSKRLCDVPLAHALAAQQQHSPAVGQTGYLTMDQTRSLLPLAADDPNVYSVPLVGVWVRSPGVRSATHPLAVAAAAKFALGGLLPDRAAQQPGGAFLLLLFPGDSPVPKCYEARFSPRQLPRAGAAGQSAAAPTPVDAASPPVTLMPYTARVELNGQTTAPLELRPLPDTQLLAQMTGSGSLPSLALLPSAAPLLGIGGPGSGIVTAHSQHGAPSPGVSGPGAQATAQGISEPMSTMDYFNLSVRTPRGGAINGTASGSGLASGAAGLGAWAGVGRGLLDGLPQLRGSGSKLMTSPSKAMKIMASDREQASQGQQQQQGQQQGQGGWGGGAWSGEMAGAATAGSVHSWGAAVGPEGRWAAEQQQGHGGPAARDSPPLPRANAAVPTPFRGPDPAGAAASGFRGAGHTGTTGSNWASTAPGASGLMDPGTHAGSQSQATSSASTAGRTSLSQLNPTTPRNPVSCNFTAGAPYQPHATYGSYTEGGHGNTVGGVMATPGVLGLGEPRANGVAISQSLDDWLKVSQAGMAGHGCGEGKGGLAHGPRGQASGAVGVGASQSSYGTVPAAAVRQAASSSEGQQQQLQQQGLGQPGPNTQRRHYGLMPQHTPAAVAQHPVDGSSQHSRHQAGQQREPAAHASDMPKDPRRQQQQHHGAQSWRSASAVPSAAMTGGAAHSAQSGPHQAADSTRDTAGVWQGGQAHASVTGAAGGDGMHKPQHQHINVSHSAKPQWHDNQQEAGRGAAGREVDRQGGSDPWDGGEEDLPSDPAVLRTEVLALRKLVRQLQAQLLEQQRQQTRPASSPAGYPGQADGKAMHASSVPPSAIPYPEAMPSTGAHNERYPAAQPAAPQVPPQPPAPHAPYAAQYGGVAVHAAAAAQGEQEAQQHTRHDASVAPQPTSWTHGAQQPWHGHAPDDRDDSSVWSMSSLHSSILSSFSQQHSRGGGSTRAADSGSAAEGHTGLAAAAAAGSGHDQRPGSRASSGSGSAAAGTQSIGAEQYRHGHGHGRGSTGPGVGAMKVYGVDVACHGDDGGGEAGAAWQREEADAAMVQGPVEVEAASGGATAASAWHRAEQHSAEMYRTGHDGVGHTAGLRLGGGSTLHTGVAPPMGAMPHSASRSARRRQHRLRRGSSKSSSSSDDEDEGSSEDDCHSGGREDTGMRRLAGTEDGLGSRPSTASAYAASSGRLLTTSSSTATTVSSSRPDAGPPASSYAPEALISNWMGLGSTTAGGGYASATPSLRAHRFARDEDSDDEHDAREATVVADAGRAAAAGASAGDVRGSWGRLGGMGAGAGGGGKQPAGARARAGAGDDSDSSDADMDDMLMKKYGIRV